MERKTETEGGREEAVESMRMGGTDLTATLLTSHFASIACASPSMSPSSAAWCRLFGSIAKPTKSAEGGLYAT
eukprot:3274733-Rhodomonas_salina.2